MKEPKPMQEIHELRHKIYKEDKHLSPKELVEKINRNADELVRRYGLKLRKTRKAA